MNDVSELVERCREPLSMSKFLSKDHLLARANEDRALAADALETLAGEVKRLNRDTVNGYTRETGAMNYAIIREALSELSGMNAMAVVTTEHLARIKARVESAESRLAKQAPVVEAARQEVASGMCQSVRLIEALATLEAAHD